MSDIEFPVNIDREMDLSKELARKSLEGVSSLDYDAFVVSDEWKWGDDERYAFAAGYVRAVEHRLIPLDRFLRLIEAKNSAEVFAMLGDTDYGKGYQDELVMLSGSEEINIEQVLKQEAERTKKLVSELTQDREQTDILFSRYDYFNLKLSLKGILGNRPVEAFFIPLGTLPPATIYQEAKEPEKSEILPPHLKEAAVQATKVYTDTKSVTDIDRIVDGSMYLHMLNRARDKEVFFLHKLITTEIDLTNIITLFRLKWVGESLSALQSALIKGGRIPFTVYYEFFPREIGDIETGFLSDEVYHDFIAEGILHLKNDNSFIRMESLIDRELMKVISREKEISFGVEILMAYYYKKSIEMKKLRTVIIGKDNGLSPDDIKARLGYVG